MGVKIDVVNDDLTGIYVSGEWLPCDSFNAKYVEPHPEIRTDGLFAVPSQPYWLVAVVVQGFALDYAVPEVTFWKNRDFYLRRRDMYVIDEMEL